MAKKKVKKSPANGGKNKTAQTKKLEAGAVKTAPATMEQLEKAIKQKQQELSINKNARRVFKLSDFKKAATGKLRGKPTTRVLFYLLGSNKYTVESRKAVVLKLTLGQFWGFRKVLERLSQREDKVGLVAQHIKDNLLWKWVISSRNNEPGEVAVILEQPLPKDLQEFCEKEYAPYASYTKEYVVKEEVVEE